MASADALGDAFDYLALGGLGIVVKSKQIRQFRSFFHDLLDVGYEVNNMDSRNSVPSLAEDRQLLWILQTGLHEVVLENSLSFAVEEAGTDHVSLEVGLDVACSQAQSLNRLDSFILDSRLSQRVILVSESRVNLLLLAFSRLRSALFLRISLLWRVLISLFLISLLLLLGRGAGPRHDVGYANEYLVLLEGVYFERGDDELCLLEVAVIEVVDDDIRVEEHLFEEADLLRLSKREVRR